MARLLFAVVVFFSITAVSDDASAQRWRRRTRCYGGTCYYQPQSQYTYYTYSATPAVSAQPTQTATRSTTSSGPQAMAEHKAGVMARTGAMWHIGGSFGGANFEGVGWGPTAQSALNNCCYTGMRQVAGQCAVQGANGMWYACKLFW